MTRRLSSQVFADNEIKRLDLATD